PRISSPYRCTPPAAAALSTLSLHDALPIFGSSPGSTTRGARCSSTTPWCPGRSGTASPPTSPPTSGAQSRPLPTTPLPTTTPRRSEEHTSELQSRENLVCRLLLEKKKIATA